MPENFDEIGLELALNGLRNFQRGMRRYEKSVESGEDANEDFADSAREATVASNTFQNSVANARRQVRDTSRSVRESSRSIRRWGQSMRESGDSTSRAGERVDGLLDGLSRGFKRAFPFVERLRKGIARFFAQGNIALVRLTFAVAAFTAAVAAAAAAVAGLTAGLAVLGKRGADINTTFRQFRINADRANVSADRLIQNLRAQAQGTVSEVRLVESANKALTGTSEEMAQVLGSRLPEVMNVARRAATVTGERVNKSFNKIISAIKNTNVEALRQRGILINQREAYRNYAREVGVATAQLSEMDKQAALLRATLNQNNQALGDSATAQQRVSLQIQRAQASMRDIVNTLAVAVRPALSDFLNFVNRNLGRLERWLNNNAEAIRFLAQGFVDGLIPVLKTVGGALGDFLSGLLEFGKRLALGGARLIGALARGFVVGANTLLFPVIIDIANFIADFLTGGSPAKRGPLSKIDEGAQALISAWVGGIGNADLTPVETVAAEVNSMLGGIANMGLNQVERRLLKLDKALLPFQNRVKALRAEFEAFNKPAQEALEAIEKQIDKAQQAVASGERGAAQRLRQLRRQQETIQEAVDSRKQELQQAKTQLALKKAQQAEERSLLQIRQRQMQLVNQGLSPAAARSEAIEEAGGGGGGITPSGLRPGGAGAIPGGGLSDVLRGGGTGETPDFEFFKKGTDALSRSKDFAQEIKTALDVGAGNAERFESNMQELNSTMDEIRNTDLVQGIFGDIRNVRQWGQDNLIEPLSGIIGSIRWLITGKGTAPDVDAPQSIANLFENIRSEGFGYAAGQIASQVGTWINENLIQPMRPQIDAFKKWFMSTETGQSLANLFARIRNEGFSVVAGDIASQVGSWMNANIVQAIKPKIQEAIDQFQDPSGEGTLANLFQKIHSEGLGTIAIGIAGKVGAWASENILDPFKDSIAQTIGEVESWDGMWDKIRREGFSYVAGTIVPNVNEWLLTNILDPVSTVIADTLDWIVGEKRVDQLRGFFKKVRNEGLGFVFGSISSKVRQWIQNNIRLPFSDFVAWLTVPGIEGGFIERVGDLPNDIWNAIGDLANFLRSRFFDPFFAWVRGDVEGGGLPGEIGSLVAAFGELPNLLFNALKSIGSVLWEVLAAPLEMVLSKMASGLNSWLDRIGPNTFNPVIGALNENFGANIPLLPSGGIDTDINLTKPSGLQPTFPGGDKGGDGGTGGARRGGIFTPGMLRVHKGEQIISNANPMAVLSRDFVHSMSAFTNMINGVTSSMAVAGGMTNIDNRTITNDHSLTVNMQNSGSQGIEMLNRLATLQSFQGG